MSLASSTRDAAADANQMQTYKNKISTASNPNQRAYYQLLISELLLDQNQIPAAEQQLNQVDVQRLEVIYKPRLALIRARLALAQNQYAKAIQLLPTLNAQQSVHLRATAWETRALALAHLAYAYDSLLARMELDKLLTDPQARHTNHLLMLDLLKQVPINNLRDTSSRDSILRGWLALGEVLQTTPEETPARSDALRNWQQRFASHPVNQTLNVPQQAMLGGAKRYPPQVALLLPLTGRFSAMAETIRDGFLSAYFDQDSTERPIIKIYDSGEQSNNITALYQQAVQEGAELVVGPLDKVAVTELIKQAEAQPNKTRKPILTLNAVDENSLSSKWVVQYALRPEDEAKQIARIAIMTGQTRAIILAPRNNLGERLSDAFKIEYARLGGQVVANESYAADSHNQSDIIENALRLQSSHARHASLTSTLNIKTEFEPRRRQDVDMIFLVASPDKARSLKAQLAFFYAGDLPIYSTSYIYDGNTNSIYNRELVGIKFTDIPWLLQNNQQSTRETWPQHMQRYPRLFAFGMDAYHLIPHLNDLIQNPLNRFPGLTGSLSVDSQNRISRESQWAKFNKQGTPETLNLSHLQQALSSDDIFALQPDE
ncbi:MAG: penicillin-binding protein activator [Gammaproteobacteria bacterium]|nr:penicillin-binding protein activator [Gammaproteobacteria bacterium]